MSHAVHRPPSTEQNVLALEQRMCLAFEAHFDPKWGSRFWLERASERGIDPRRDVRSLADLGVLGDLAQDDLIGRPIRDFVPRRFHGALPGMIMAQTGGATGRSAWTAYSHSEFREAFVDPFVAAAERFGFPTGETWLFAGPSGPHIIGRASQRLARAMLSPPPFMVDFDPRWARKLESGSFAQRRYLHHVVEQSVSIVREQGATVIFTTPPVAEAIGAALSQDERGRIRALHYGGMRIDPEALKRLQTEVFPAAMHLSGYGNTLMGCCLELDLSPGRTPTYFPFGHRLHFTLLDEGDATERGRVRMSRFDETYIVVNLLERDFAAWADVPAGAPHGFGARGLCDPSPSGGPSPKAIKGLY